MQILPLDAASSFEPTAHRNSLIRMYSELDERQRVELINQLSDLPQHIHALAKRGLIADRLPAGEITPPGAQNPSSRRRGRAIL